MDGSPPAIARRSGWNRSRLANHEPEFEAGIMAELHVIPTAKTLKVGARKRRQPKPANALRATARWPTWVSVGAVAVGGLLLVLSLQHLATGVMAITGANWWEALLLAIGIDLGLVVTECAAIVASPAVARSIRFYVWAMITSTLALSAGLNAWALAQHSTGVMVYASCAFGFFIPLMVFGFSKVAIALTGRH
jgi:hypothetical protein